MNYSQRHLARRMLDKASDCGLPDLTGEANSEARLRDTREDFGEILRMMTLARHWRLRRARDQIS